MTDPITARAIVASPGQDRVELFGLAAATCSAFCLSNGLRQPAAFINAPDLEGYGWYDGRRVFVNVRRCRVPIDEPGRRRWSFTGWKSDRTPAGVTAHETGHHADVALDRPSRALPPAWRSEARLTSYEPSAPESFAEAFRLFVLNPDLLRLGRPARFAFLTETLELKPAHDLPWRAVLANAHPRLVEAAERWIR